MIVPAAKRRVGPLWGKEDEGVSVPTDRKIERILPDAASKTCSAVSSDGSPLLLIGFLLMNTRLTRRVLTVT